LQPTTELRSRGRTKFVVVRGSLDAEYDRPVRLRFELPAGIDSDHVAVRVVAPHADIERRSSTEHELDGSLAKARYLVTIPQSEFGTVAAAKDAGALLDVTGPADSARAEARDDRRALHRLREGWWWIVPLGALLAAALPAWLWRRAARSFFAMRVPGAGKDMSAGPPSTLDPVGAAVMAAGAGPIDAVGAFAAHVLDLVERRQLQLRRATGSEHGSATLVGLAHADDADSDDIAVTALRDVALDDGITVRLADAPSQRTQLPEDAQLDWGIHVGSRARFERLVDVPRAERIAAAGAALAVFAVVGGVGGMTAELDGQRAAGWLAAATCGPAAALLVAWSRDARTWRRVTRSRRTERAPWLAWRRSLVEAKASGGTLDARMLPLVVATGPLDGLVRDQAGPDAVGLDAVTTRTVAALRTLAGDPTDP
jgi:hypothetical protein